MNVVKTDLEGVVIIEPKIFGDSRGFFFESYHDRRYKEYGIDSDFVQDNVSFSAKNTLRGLHYQFPHGQTKLVQVLQGSVYDVAVDIRLGSPTFKQWVGVELTAENKKQFFIPNGFAHGFCVLSDTAMFMYKCTDYYFPEHESGILWEDPELGINWPVTTPILSNKDSKYGMLNNIGKDMLPNYEK